MGISAMWNAISPRFELMSPCPIPATITITPRAPPQNRWIYCDVKSTLNVSVSITIIRTLISGKLYTQWWMLVEITGTNKMYTTKRYKRARSVLNLKVHVWHVERYLKMLDFFQETRSIFTFTLFFGKNKYKIHSYTSNMNDFKTICIYENCSIFAYFFKRREDFSRHLKKCLQ